MAGPVSLKMKSAFSKSFCYYLGFDCSGWIGLIKKEIIITTGMVWLVSFNEWKVP